MRIIINTVIPTFLLLLLAASPTTTAQSIVTDPAGRPCGFKIAPCPTSQTCVANDPSCPATRGENCAGTCQRVPITMSPPPTPTYSACGGKRATPLSCRPGFLCVDDPRHGPSCGMACDAQGICVRPTASCGGIIGRACPTGLVCVDDPRDECVVAQGGRDCGGICV